MGLISKEVEVKLTGSNIIYYENLSYTIPRENSKWGGMTVPRGTKIIIKVEDLPNKSAVKVDIECDNCKKELKNIAWNVYMCCVKPDGKYYCNSCANKLYANKNAMLTRLKNGKSFEQWCIENSRQDVLDRWDYKLNKLNPNEINYGTKNKYYFKCPKGIHDSELKTLGAFTNGQEGSIKCNQCNSFAQWGIDNISEDFLEKYWDYKKNIIDPWEILSQYNKKIWIICQEKDYHDSYSVAPNDFVSSKCRCPFCNKNSGKIHYLDSLGKLLEDKDLLLIWSDKNDKSPYEYSPHSSKEVYWKCTEGKHNDYYRNIGDSNKCNFRCPECNCSQGESIISAYFTNKINIFYIPQKTFNGLIGLGGGLLSYDHFTPKYNLLIEFQGIQHEKPIDFSGKGIEFAKLDFERQIEHDRRKKEYALQNGYNFLEIWYYDIDNIETILGEYLNFLTDVLLIA